VPSLVTSFSWHATNRNLVALQMHIQNCSAGTTYLSLSCSHKILVKQTRSGYADT